MSPHKNPFEDETFTNIVHDAMEHFHIPGLSIAIVHGDDTFAAGYGSAQLALDKHVAATPETLWYAASTSKSFTAAALAVLMDDHKDGPESKRFDWKTRVTYLISRDDFVLQDTHATEHATLEDLACHRTGMGRHDLSCRGATPRDLVRSMRHLPYALEFREKYMYNNLMYITLGYIAECVSGVSLPELWRTRIWEPLEMHTTTAVTEEAMRMEEAHSGSFFARGYHWDEVASKYVPVPFKDMSATRGAGGIISSALDYAKYLRMLINQGQPLSKDAHDKLRTPRSIALARYTDLPMDGPSTYSLGWSLEFYRGVEIINHAGGLIGFSSYMAFVPSRQYGVVLFSNTSGTAGAAQEYLFYTLLDDMLEVPQAERFDWRKHYDQQAEEGATQIEKLARATYPHVPDPPLVPALPLSEYTATYTSVGYGSLTFTQGGVLNPTIPRWRANSSTCTEASKQTSDTPVLVVDASDRSYPHVIELEHVSGEYWLAWVSAAGIEFANGGRYVMGCAAAEFRIGSDGKVSEVGFAWEEAMKGEKIWYQRAKERSD